MLVVSVSYRWPQLKFELHAQSTPQPQSRMSLWLAHASHVGHFVILFNRCSCNVYGVRLPMLPPSLPLSSTAPSGRAVGVVYKRDYAHHYAVLGPDCHTAVSVVEHSITCMRLASPSRGAAPEPVS